MDILIRIQEIDSQIEKLKMERQGLVEKLEKQKSIELDFDDLQGGFDNLDVEELVDKIEQKKTKKTLIRPCYDEVYVEEVIRKASRREVKNFFFQPILQGGIAYPKMSEEDEDGFVKVLPQSYKETFTFVEDRRINLFNKDKNGKLTTFGKHCLICSVFLSYNMRLRKIGVESGAMYFVT